MTLQVFTTLVCGVDIFRPAILDNLLHDPTFFITLYTQDRNNKQEKKIKETPRHVTMKKNI